MLLEDGFVFGFPMNEKVKISIFTFSDLIPIMTSKWYITLTHYYDYVDDIENNFLIFLNIIIVGLWNATLDVFSSPAMICMKFDDLRRASLWHLVHQKSPSLSPDSIFPVFYSWWAKFVWMVARYILTEGYTRGTESRICRAGIP